MGHRLIFDTPYGATPLEPEELDGLKLKSISTKSQLDEYEQLNIIQAEIWLFSRKRKNILTTEFTLKLHEKMFGDVWRWAGTMRTTGKNIGVDATIISIELHNLMDDVRYQIENKTYSWDELAARFHHRLVSIHVFANGNGRHARMFADALLRTYGEARFTWGSDQNARGADVRKQYITALREADKGSIASLLKFVRS